MAFSFDEYLDLYRHSEYGNGIDSDENCYTPLLKVDCLYYDIDDMKQLLINNQNFVYSQVHINIRSLPAKYDQLKTMISELDNLGINMDFIMLCETFLNETNMNIYQIAGYQFVCNNRLRGKGGGVAMYIKDKFHVVQRTDLTVNHGTEFESIFVEASYNDETLIVGEIYRIPGSNESVSIKRYESILRSLTNFKGTVMIGTDQNFNYLNVERHDKTLELLNLFISSGFFPTITIPTRITHESSSLIDNIYVKLNTKHEVVSGAITADISDHLPIFNLIGRQPLKRSENKYIKTRKLNDGAIQSIKQCLDLCDWFHILNEMSAENAHKYFIALITKALDQFAPEKTLKIKPQNIIRQPWMTPELLELSRTKY